MCGFEPSSGHMWDKPSSACGWSGGFSWDLLFSPHLPFDLAQMSEIFLAGCKTQIKKTTTYKSRKKDFFPDCSILSEEDLCV